MNEELRKLEDATRTSPEYARAVGLLAERERLELQLQILDRELEALAVASKLARIDKLRQSLLASARVIPLAG